MLGGKKAVERAMCLTRQPGARPTALIFGAHSLWQATWMVVIGWIVKDYFASKGKAGAQAMFVLDIFLRQGAYSCAGMLLQAFAQELDAFYVGSPGAITEGQTIFKMDFLFERWKQSIQKRGQSGVDGLSSEVVHNGRMWRASRKS